MIDLEHVRERLREWAHYHRDHARRGRSGSAEGLWRSPQCWEAPTPRPAFDLRRALETHALLRDHVPSPNVRALTYRYCWPRLSIHLTLRLLSKRIGYRVDLNAYELLVSNGETRFALLLAAHEKKRGAEAPRRALPA